ncbi:radical SAM/SPASM domain-containing protein [Saccharibacillus deserti]|uniref:radical SAM/SPASM domain-containing protein n=1 Tax=Saccharibacillus deserti TaxID=1634444 RepID=UPI001554D338|nr:radical SAM protein [Saccharibacillus deserti]
MNKISFPKIAVYKEKQDYIVHNFQLNSWVVFGKSEYDIASKIIFQNRSEQELIVEGYEKDKIVYILNLLLLYKIGYIEKLPEEYKEYNSYKQKKIESEKPSTMYFVTTYKCNLNCIYCYAESSPTRSTCDDLNTEEAMRMFENVQELGVETIVFTGGEAFLRKDIFELIEFVRNLNMNANIITNGSLIQNKKVAGKLASLANLITISLDSMDAAKHDLNRGKGSWEKAKKAIDLLVEAKANLKINQTITKNNLNASEKVLKFANLNNLHVKVIATSSLGRGKDFAFSQSLNRYERIKLDEKLFDLNRKKANKLSIKQFEHKKHCGHGVGEFSIDSMGNIYLCKLLHDDKMVAGNIKNDDLKTVFYESDLFMNAKNRTVHNISGCKDCTFKEFCGGGCRAIQASQDGDLDQTDFHECFHIRKNFKTQMWSYFKN